MLSPRPTQLKPIFYILIVFKKLQVIQICNQGFKPVVLILISKASFLILLSSNLRVIILVTGSYNVIAQKATKEVRPKPCILHHCAHRTRRGKPEF